MKILNDIMFDGEQFGHLMVKLVFDWISQWPLPNKQFNYVPRCLLGF
jgi:hypothetical protein